jgi:hypothetical protein
MSQLAIAAEGLSKRYPVGGPRAAYGTLRDAVGDLVRRRRGGTGERTYLWALEDVSF